MGNSKREGFSKAKGNMNKKGQGFKPKYPLLKG